MLFVFVMIALHITSIKPMFYRHRFIHGMGYLFCCLGERWFWTKTLDLSLAGTFMSRAEPTECVPYAHRSRNESPRRYRAVKKSGDHRGTMAMRDQDLIRGHIKRLEFEERRCAEGTLKAMWWGEIKKILMVMMVSGGSSHRHEQWLFWMKKWKI